MKMMKCVVMAGLLAVGCGDPGGEPEPDVCNGDGRCTGDETENNCPEDCEPNPLPNTCNNNKVCDSGETTQTCAADCPAPPACVVDGVCAADEQYETCAMDCAAKLRVQNTSSYAIYYLYVKRCTDAAWGGNQLGAYILYSNQSFTLGSIPPGCWNLKANDAGFVHTWMSSQGFNFTKGTTFTWTLYN